MSEQKITDKFGNVGKFLSEYRCVTPGENFTSTYSWYVRDKNGLIVKSAPVMTMAQAQVYCQKNGLRKLLSGELEVCAQLA